MRTQNFSNLVIIIGVLVMALIAGVSLSTYSADREIIGGSGAVGTSATLSEVTQSLTEIELLTDERTTPLTASEVEKLRATIPDLEEKIAILAANPRYEDDKDLQEFTMHLSRYVGHLKTFVDSQSPSPEEIEAIGDEAHELLDHFRTIIDLQVQSDLTRENEIIQKLRQSTFRSLTTSFFTVLIALIGMAYFVRMSSRTQALAIRNERLANRATALNDAKSRLLTMLSHELRTPLNGILGLSNILLQSKLDHDDRVLVEQINSSAIDLTHVVTDMLDFTDFATIGIDPDADRILSHYFFAALKSEGEAIAKSYGKSFDMEIEDNFPPHFICDYSRLTRSFGYVFNDVLKNAPIEALRVYFGVSDHALIFRTDFEYQYGFDTDWQVEFITEQPDADPDRILSQGMDSTMARGLFETLGANMRVIHNEANANQHRLLIEVPVDLQNEGTIYVAPAEPDMKLPESLVETLEAISAMFVTKLADAELILASYHTNERTAVAKLREIAPRSTIVGIGKFVDPESYDYVIDDPEWGL